MGWNGSGMWYQKKIRTYPKEKAFHKSTFNIRFIFVFIALSFVAVCTCLILNDSKRADTIEDKRPSPPKTRKINAPKIKVPTNASTTIPQKKIIKAEDYWKDKIYVDEKGVKRYPGGARWVDPNREVELVKHPISRMGRLFKHHSERHIAGLLELEPGAAVFGTITYGKNLNDDFMVSCKEQIEFDENDTEEDRALKIAVEETKKDLLDRISAGEDFVKILKEAREEAQRLGAYRSELKKQIDEIVRDENYTDQDIEDFTTAANMMLEKEGLPKIRTPHIIVRQEIIRRAREQKLNNKNKEK